MNRLLILLLLLLPVNVALSQFDTLYVIMRGDTTEIWQKTELNCNSHFVGTATLSNDTVLVLETDTSSALAFCDCPFTMRTSLIGLPIGSYHALIYLQRLKKYLPYLPNDTTWLYGSIDFTITGQSAFVMAQDFRQSTCNGSLDDVQPQAHSILPVDLRLSIFPNPFNPGTTIEYSVPHTNQVTLEVFDILGRRVARLLDESQSGGIHRVHLSAAEISSGMYVCRLRVGTQVIARRFLAIR